MNEETQKRTGRGLTVLLIAFGVDLVIPRLSSAIISAVLARTYSGDVVFKLQSVAGFLCGALVSLLLLVGLLLLLRSLGSYAQFALAGLIATMGLDLLQQAFMLSSRRSVMNISLFVDLGNSATWVATCVALLLLLRKATTAASATPSIVATVLICVKLAYSLLLGVLLTALSRFGFGWSSVIPYLNFFAHAISSLSFMWLAFRARRATLGLLLDPTALASDAYRGPTALR